MLSLFKFLKGENAEPLVFALWKTLFTELFFPPIAYAQIKNTASKNVPYVFFPHFGICNIFSLVVITHAFVQLWQSTE